jgi:glutathione-regulated potassium-efflux system ancillary protein KefG
MKKILILFAHPALQKSRVNKYLIENITDVEGVTFHDLYQLYPEMDIDVKFEQELLTANDIIIFHYPFFWYSVPAILKEWQDLVLEHGWAYGHAGNALKGKWFFNVLTTGGSREAYCKEGYNNFTIKQLLAPIQQTVNLCKMICVPPFVVHGTHSISHNEIKLHKQNYHKILQLLRDNELDIDSLTSLNYLNDYIDLKKE